MIVCYAQTYHRAREESRETDLFEPESLTAFATQDIFGQIVSGIEQAVNSVSESSKSIALNVPTGFSEAYIYQDARNAKADGIGDGSDYR